MQNYPLTMTSDGGADVTKTIMQSLASDIADSLAADLRRLSNREAPGPAGIADQLLDALVNHVVEAMYVHGGPGREIAGPVDPGNQNLERGGVDLDSVNSDGDDEVHGSRSSFPNLKYAKPKYKNVESILKYIEESQDTGGLKLVIMNFND